MAEKTITEALAERKVIAARIQKKRDAISRYVVLPATMRDPIKDDGGSPKYIREELQAISDLEKQQVAILRAIQRVNGETLINIGGVERTVADWLIWRRDVAPAQGQFLQNLVNGISKVRADKQRQGASLVSPEAAANAKDIDVVVNLSETNLMSRVEELEVTLGTLDGQLSLKNATVIVSY